jgi:hypothetical protein
MNIDIVYESRHQNTKGKAKEIIINYIEGYSASELANLYTVNVSVIREIIIKNGVSLRNKKESRNILRYNEKRNNTIYKKFTEDEIKDIIQEYSNGKGVNYVSKKYSVDNCVIIRVLNENGIKKRNRKEQYKYKNVTNELFKQTIILKYNGWGELIKRYQEKFKEEYGVINPMQVAEYFEKQQNSAFSTKTFIVGEKEFKIQGYENKAINLLLAKGYTKDDIETGKCNMPSFTYTYNGKEHRYYPDIFIIKEKRIIEVKSEYTFKIDLERNLAKKKCVEENGYKFDFLIF